VAEFRALWMAQLLSVVGDQLARVALTVLVYDRTRSALLAAITFALSIVPTFIGGMTLAWLADRYPRRRVMIACDLVRGAIVLVMAIPGLPLAALVSLLFLVTLIEAPFTAARAAIFPDVLSGDRYVMGTAVTLTTYQLAQVYNAPEGVAAPLAHTLGGGAATVGVILAANSLGQTVGAITFSRFVAPPTRLRLMGPLAICACAVLVLFFWEPDLAISLLILVTAGLCAAYQLAANAAFVTAAPQEQRSQAFGLAQGAMSLGQGVVMILAGAAAEHHAPARTIAVCGAVGATVAVAVAVSGARGLAGLTSGRHQHS